MRTWNSLTEAEKQIFTDKLHYGYLLHPREHDTLYEMEVQVWMRPLTEEEIKAAREILDFVKEVANDVKASG